ncbi:hypothetical protein M0812_05260 [Anaeramoeba flamelloides]|uniref:B30.2/SPRY domain-containing protein n=1 Tax=Anaeramoeba flamelloides TaxID=1746091 RepID=A0AAV8A486_9EUKA|nr:hypothetical protein M0812_05260 [Anaeramoeba flamelloides]
MSKFQKNKNENETETPTEIKKNICSLHNEVLKFYCSKDDCLECEKCYEEKKQDHEGCLVEMEQAWKTYFVFNKNPIKNKELKKSHLKITGYQKNLQGTKQKLLEKQKEDTKNLTNLTKLVHTELDLTHKKLVQSMDNEYKEKQGILNQEIERAEQTLDSISKGMLLSKNLTQSLKKGKKSNKGNTTHKLSNLLQAEKVSKEIKEFYLSPPKLFKNIKTTILPDILEQLKENNEMQLPFHTSKIKINFFQQESDKGKNFKRNKKVTISLSMFKICIDRNMKEKRVRVLFQENKKLILSIQTPSKIKHIVLAFKNYENKNNSGGSYNNNENENEKENEKFNRYYYPSFVGKFNPKEFGKYFFSECNYGGESFRFDTHSFQVYTSDSFDPNGLDKCLQLQNNNTTVRGSGDDFFKWKPIWGTKSYSRGKHVITLEITDAFSWTILIGVGLKEADHGEYYNSKYAYFLDPSSGKKVHSGLWKKYGEPCTEVGDKVEILLDKDKNTLSFLVNDSCPGTAFTIPSNAVKLMVLLASRDEVISIH